jgi:hypothetical protein
MPMTMPEILALGEQAADSLKLYGSVRIEYQPGNGTRYDVVIAQQPDRVGPATFGVKSDESQWVVSVVNFGTCYDLPREAAHPTYIADKLADGRDHDGAALHLLFAAILGEGTTVTLADAGV